MIANCEQFSGDKWQFARAWEMDGELLEILLQKSENETLDFKRGQYRFISGSHKEKSELLEAILAFANAWKETDADIIIGVEEKDGRATGRPGVSDASTRCQHAAIRPY